MSTLASSLLIEPFSFLQVTRTTIKSQMSFEIRPDPTTDCNVSCPLSVLKNPHRLIMGDILEPQKGLTFLLDFLIRELTEGKRTCIKA